MRKIKGCMKGWRKGHNRWGMGGEAGTWSKAISIYRQRVLCWPATTPARVVWSTATVRPLSTDACAGENRFPMFNCCTENNSCVVLDWSAYNPLTRTKVRFLVCSDKMQRGNSRLLCDQNLHAPYFSIFRVSYISWHWPMILAAQITDREEMRTRSGGRRTEFGAVWWAIKIAPHRKKIFPRGKRNWKYKSNLLQVVHQL